MADDEELPGPVAVAPPERPFVADRPKNARAKCKRCKLACEAGKLRLGRYVWNNFSASGGWAKAWHHPACLWEAFSKQRAATKKVEDPGADIEGWENLVQEDMDQVIELMRGAGQQVPTPKKPQPPQPPQRPQPCKDDYFRAFRKLCVDLNDEPSYLAKTALVAKMFKDGCAGDGFKGDLETWVRLLLPMVEKRIYNLQSKQLVKLFSKIFETNEEEMLEDLTHGDVAETVRIFFERSAGLKPAAKSNVLIAEVDEFLERLARMTKEDEQAHHFTQIAKRCTPNDLKMVIRLVKHDLRINAGPKHILAAIHPDAYAAFQTCRDLRAVVRKATAQPAPGAPGAPGAGAAEAKQARAGKGAKGPGAAPGRSSSGSPSKGLASGALAISMSLMTPVLPMLAEACKSVEQAMKKCPNGMFSEIKYDGERVQVHKQGDNFKYFSRALKPVMAHKVNHFKDYIPDAFPGGEDLVLDTEILLIDTKSGKPLPFGSLGVHKQSAFKDANVCLFVFDCMYYNGKSLMHKSMKARRKILEKVMVEIPNRILFSEQEEIHSPEDLTAMMEKVFRLGLEGLVLKDLEGPYEPGKRHWLKVKKDYLFGGAMADTADLVVLGAFYGTGQKGGMMSIFLMGCFDPGAGRWCTVTKVHGGHDDETLARLQTELKMVKINKDPLKIPSWLKANKQMFPDFVAADPEDTQVWEITGAEFTKTEVHTALGISVRFPRVTRIRDDKTWKEATTLPELLELYRKSKETASLSLAELARTSAATSPAKASAASPSKASPRKRPRRSDSASPASPASPRKVMKGPSKPLPDVFQGVQLRLPLPPGLGDDEARDLRRYFVGYGGTLLDRGSKERPTHVLHCSASRSRATGSGSGGDAGGAVNVDVKWVWDSIKRQRLLDADGYAL